MSAEQMDLNRQRIAVAHYCVQKARDAMAEIDLKRIRGLTREELQAYRQGVHEARALALLAEQELEQAQAAIERAAHENHSQ